MPEFGKGQSSTRRQTDLRDHFSWSTPSLKVTARPTDPYERPASDPNLASFVENLRNIESVTNGYITLQKTYKEGNTQKGAADAVQGKPYEEPEEGLFNGGYGYKEAFNVTQGEVRGSTFKKEYLTKLEENNYFQNDPEPQKAHDKFFQDLYTHHFSEVGNNPQLMFGASEQLKQAQIEGAVAFQKASYDTAKTSFNNAVSQMQQDHLYTYAHSPQGEADVENLRRLMNDDWSLRVKPTGYVTRDEFSKMVVSNIGTMAVKLAEDNTKTASEAMAAAYKLLSLYDAPDPDTKQSWNSMVDGTGKLKFRPDIEAIESRINRIHEEREKADVAAFQRRKDDEEKDLFVKYVLDPDVPYAQAQTAITSAKYQDANNVQSLMAKLYEFRNGEKNIIQDYPHIVSLRERVETAGSVKQLMDLRSSVIKGYGSRLNAETAKDLQERITSRINNLKADARSDRSMSLEERKLGWDMLKSVVGTQSMYDLDGTQAAMRMDQYGRMFWGRVNAGESPQSVSSDLIGKYGKDTGRSASEVFGPSKYTSAEAIKADVQSGKLRPDEGVLEMKRFMATKPQ